MPRSILTAKEEYDAMTPSILSPAEKFMYKLMLPLYDHMSKNSREKGVELTPEQMAWDEMIKRFNAPVQGIPGVSGAVVPNPNTNIYQQPYLLGRRG